jgi:predicted regulator of Ras-like GTPase activity (Roadblock/LC7/MglB family)
MADTPPLIATPQALGENLGWLLDDLAARLPNLVGAVLASTDGIPRFSTGFERANGERISALGSGMYSLARNVGPSLGRPDKSTIKQAFLETDSNLVFVMGAADGTLLTVVTELGADVGLVGHEMSRLVVSMRTHLATPARQADQATPGDGGQ